MSRGALDQAVEQLAGVLHQQELLPEGIEGQQVTQGILKSIASGQGAELQALLSTGAGVAGAAACAAVGAVALAPLCGAAGKIAGEVIGGLFSSKASPPSERESEVFYPKQLLSGWRSDDLAYLKGRFDDILFSSLAKLHDQEAYSQQLEDLVDAYFYLPEFDEFWMPKNGLPFAEEPLGGGFSFILFNPTWVFGPNTKWEDFDDPQWMDSYVESINWKLKGAGIDFSHQTKIILEQLKKDDFRNPPAAPDSGSTPPGSKQDVIDNAYKAARFWARCVQLYKLVKKPLWEKLEGALKAGLERVFASVALQTKASLIKATNDLGDQLAKEAGCTSVACKADFREAAAEYAQALATSSPKEVLASMRKELGQGGKKGRRKPSTAPSAPPAPKPGGSWIWTGVKWIFVAALTGAALFAGVQVAQGKPVVPPALKRKLGLKEKSE